MMQRFVGFLGTIYICYDVKLQRIGNLVVLSLPTIC